MIRRRLAPTALLRFFSTELPTALTVLNDADDALDPTVRPETSPTTSTAALRYFQSLGFDLATSDGLLKRFPLLSRVSFCQPLSAKLAFLSSKGMNRDGMIRFFSDLLSSYPEFLDLDLEGDIQPVFDYLSSLGLTDEEILVMVIQYPHLVGYDVADVFHKKVEFLQRLTFEAGQIAQILLSFPQFFGVSLESNMDPVVTYFTQEMDLSTTEIKKIILKCPQILGLRLAATRAKLDFLIESGFELSVIRALIKRFPAFLKAPLKEDLRPTIELLLEYSPKEAVHNLFYQCPQTLLLSYDREILPKIRFFVEMGYDPVDLRILLEQFPEVLCYSLEDEIMPTVQKSIDVGLSLLETRITFARDPELFRQSIAKVTRDIDQQCETERKQLTI